MKCSLPIHIAISLHTPYNTKVDFKKEVKYDERNLGINCVFSDISIARYNVQVLW